ncbi:MAG: hypothetical protein IPL36_09590 [Nigerium sp.]|nr:hypothetical protein [Nigerium sp.]
MSGQLRLIARRNVNTCVTTLQVQGDTGEFLIGSTAAGDTITHVSITFYLSPDPGPLTWSADSGSVWSKPVDVGTTTVDGAPARMFRTTYAGSVSAHDGMTVVPGAVDFTTSQFTECDPLKVWVRRAASVNGIEGSSLVGPRNFFAPVAPESSRRTMADGEESEARTKKAPRHDEIVERHTA